MVHIYTKYNGDVSVIFSVITKKVHFSFMREYSVLEILHQLPSTKYKYFTPTLLQVHGFFYLFITFKFQLVLRPGTPVLEVIFNKYFIFEFSNHHSDCFM